MAKTYKICVMTEEAGRIGVRTFSASAWWPRTFFLAALAVFSAAASFAVHGHLAVSGWRDGGMELELLRSEQAGGERKLAAADERIGDLERKLALLSSREEDLKLITREFNQRLGLPEDAVLAKLWPALTGSVAWTWGGNEGRGGLEPGASPKFGAGGRNEALKALHRDLDRLEREAGEADLAINALKAALDGSRRLLDATPAELPVLGGRLTSPFGSRTSPFGRSADFHQGLDLAAPVGTPVYAPAEGKVLSSEWSGSGYGLMVALDHGFGLVTRYAHLSESLVEPGSTVKKGQAVAKVGNTGRSTGPHLHYETVLGGAAVDPLLFGGTAAAVQEAAD